MSLLPFCGKKFDQLICNKTFQKLIENELISYSQSCCKPGDSCIKYNLGGGEGDVVSSPSPVDFHLITQKR